ncbi:Kelch repeat type 1 [Corchorus olitorius]|uniref:Kelch repeat type 1 n=1 Tax=Corchorus olitorius TaxID=93759 RepID=A0A1R3KAJ5_9ROSI|nr:Kelch repeat type 1 [Corchorus olitorius]
MTSKQSSKHSGPDLEGDIDARFDEKLARFKEELKAEIMLEFRDMLESLQSKKETAAANDASSTTTAAALASFKSTKQPRPLREGGIKRLHMIECWSEDYYSFKYFVLDLEKGEETTLTISPASDEDRVAVHMNFSVVSLGTIIYMIGGNCADLRCPDGLQGDHHPHQHVRYFDTLEPEKGWKLGVPMHSGRSKPAAVVVDGKIYVFGGIQTNPTAFPQARVPYVHSDGTKRILINSLVNVPSLYEYHLNEQKWRILDRNCHKYWNQGAYLDHILYSVSDDSKNPLWGFDLIRKQWFPVKLPQLDDGITFYFRTASVFSSGSDKLCLVWHYYDVTRKGHDKRCKVECLELKPRKSYSASGGLSLTASIEFHEVFYVLSGGCEKFILPLEVSGVPIFLSSNVA